MSCKIEAYDACEFVVITGEYRTQPHYTRRFV
jgi:hypothetical protein